MNPKHQKNYRLLDLYIRLCEGKTICKADEANRLGVDQRSIQRDIDDIRSFLANRTAEAGTEQREIIYDRAKKGFRMVGADGTLMTNSEILAVSKILLESRAFTKKEISSILDKLIAGCVPQKNMKLVTDLIANEKYHYVELHHKSRIQDNLWMLGCSIRQSKLLEIVYHKQVSSKETVKRIVEPVAILFSEYYFYLNAYIVEKDESGKYVHKYGFPAVFRIDRLGKCIELKEKIRNVSTDRFQEGEFRKRVQFMYAGELTRLHFRYSGRNVEAILDRLPTARILSQNTEGYIIEAEVYGKGILMWLLSQGSAVEVLRPMSLREEMKRILAEMLGNYQ